MELRIRELQAYGYDDDADSSVNIHVEPGAIVNVRASQADSDSPPPRRKPRWAKLLAAAISAAVGLTAAVKALYDALH